VLAVGLRARTASHHKSMIEILVVDDNQKHVLLVKECLSTYRGVSVTVAEDGQHALRLLAIHDYRPDLILLELLIPIVDGHEVLRRIRRKNLAIPIVVLSVSRSQDDISLAYASGANMYAEKPSSPGSFRRTIHAIAQLWLEPETAASAASAK